MFTKGTPVIRESTSANIISPGDREFAMSKRLQWSVWSKGPVPGESKGWSGWLSLLAAFFVEGFIGHLTTGSRQEEMWVHFERHSVVYHWMYFDRLLLLVWSRRSVLSKIVRMLSIRLSTQLAHPCSLIICFFVGLKAFKDSEKHQLVTLSRMLMEERRSWLWTPVVCSIWGKKKIPHLVSPPHNISWGPSPQLLGTDTLQLIGPKVKCVLYVTR